jgi:hypothetical protein
MLLSFSIYIVYSASSNNGKAFQVLAVTAVWMAVGAGDHFGRTNAALQQGSAEFHARSERMVALGVAGFASHAKERNMFEQDLAMVDAMLRRLVSQQH